MGRNLAVHIARVGVTDRGEHAPVGADYGRDDGHCAILLAGHLDELRDDGAKSLVMCQRQDACVCGNFFLADLPAFLVVNVDHGGERCVTAVCAHWKGPDLSRRPERHAQGGGTGADRGGQRRARRKKVRHTEADGGNNGHTGTALTSRVALRMLWMV